MAGRGRTLLTVVAVDVVLFIVANVTYGMGNNDKHGAMRTVSNVVWAIFLVGFFVMILVAITALVQKLRRR
jgi:hypothetical protein